MRIFKKKSTYSSFVPTELNFSYSPVAVETSVADSPTESKNTEFGLPLERFMSSGSYISTTNAMRVDTVFTCIRDKSETVGRIPLKLYRRGVDGKRDRVLTGREFRIWTQEPNDYMGMINFLEFYVQSLETTGAFYAYRNLNSRGAMMEMIPFRNQRNVVPQMDLNGNVYYTYTFNDGKPGISFGNDELFIVKLTTTDGFTPISPISYNAQMLLGTEGAEQSWSKIHTDSITSQIYLSTDKTLSQDAAERLKKQWGEYRGPQGITKTPILEDNLKVHPLNLSPKDQELLKSREYSVNRICQIFRVPPQRVGMPGSQSNQEGLLEIDEYYMRNGIEPLLRKFEETANREFRRTGSKLEVEFDRRAFYSGSPKTLVEITERELKGGMATVNEARADNQRDPVDGGDVFVVDNNNCVYGRWDELPAIREQIYNRQTSQQSVPGGEDEA